jgi:hypothetical protein
MARKTNKAVVVEVVANVAEVLAETNVQVAENTEVQTEVVAKVTKADIGRTIFNESLATGNLVRKDVIARLVAEAGLTKAGAATYFQNMKNKAGLVVHKTKEEVTA